MNRNEDMGLSTGDVIGHKYSVVRQLGAGGMGAVYEAVNVWTSRRVAVKVLLASPTPRPDIEKRFMQEAQAASSLRHPNIVDVLDMGRDDATGSLYIVQEFLEGTDLASVLATHGPFLAREAFEILVPVVGALIAAHEAGVVHRDIKPDNIFIAKGKGSERVPKLIDFGIAKVIASSRPSRHHTAADQVIGTIQYMSPEQARSESTLDARSDVWSIGVVLYEMLTGQLPFSSENPCTLLARLMSGAATPIETLAPDLPDSVSAIVRKALSVDKLDRFQSMREMLDAVADCALYSAEAPEKSLRARHKRSLPSRADKPAGELHLAAQALSLPPPARLELVPSPVIGAKITSSPRTLSSRKSGRRNDRQRARLSSQRAVKATALGLLLASVASMLLAWNAVQQISEAHAQMNATLNQLNAVMRQREPAPTLEARPVTHDSTDRFEALALPTPRR